MRPRLAGAAGVCVLALFVLGWLQAGDRVLATPAADKDRSAVARDNMPEVKTPPAVPMPQQQDYDGPWATPLPTEKAGMAPPLAPRFGPPPRPGASQR